MYQAFLFCLGQALPALPPAFIAISMNSVNFSSVSLSGRSQVFVAGELLFVSLSLFMTMVTAYAAFRRRNKRGGASFGIIAQTLAVFSTIGAITALALYVMFVALRENLYRVDDLSQYEWLMPWTYGVLIISLVANLGFQMCLESATLDSDLAG